jgi:hypothetical protein
MEFLLRIGPGAIAMEPTTPKPKLLKLMADTKNIKTNSEKLSELKVRVYRNTAVATYKDTYDILIRGEHRAHTIIHRHFRQDGQRMEAGRESRIRGEIAAFDRADFGIEEASMLHEIDTVIVGGGQAGLAISYYLTQEGRKHVALERAPAVANPWRNQRWDSFTLVTSNFQMRMPGAEYSGKDPYGFMSLAEVVEYFDNYVERFRLPVLCGVEVISAEMSATDMPYGQARRR